MHMKKLLFILLNLTLSSNIIWLIFILPLNFLPEDRGYFLFAYGTLFYVLTISIFKINIMTFLYNKYQKNSFIYEILDKLKNNSQYRKRALTVIALFDLIIFVIFSGIYIFILKHNLNIEHWQDNIFFLLIFYFFSFGGVLGSYISFWLIPWIKSRYNEKI